MLLKLVYEINAHRTSHERRMKSSKILSVYLLIIKSQIIGCNGIEKYEHSIGPDSNNDVESSAIEKNK